MFDKFKQLNELRQLQKELQRQKFSATRNGITVVVNGSMSVEDVTLNADLTPIQQQEDLKNCINDAMKSAQKGMAEKMKGMNLGGLM